MFNFRMKYLGMSSNNGTIFFGQVYGMCDYISYALGTFKCFSQFDNEHKILYTSLLKLHTL